MFFRRSPKGKLSGIEKVRALVREQLPDADEDTVEIVSALAGLLTCIAYADRKFDATEAERARAALTSVEGLSGAGADAIGELLRAHMPEIATINPQAYTRTLRERSSVELRREVLDILVDLAAADGELALAETDLLRRTTAALGLDPSDYSASQDRHRDKLKLLKG
jgi:uncharacterized tellurite resistance protein B-like protein